MHIQGFCRPEFSQVREEFERNFQQRGELGASVCVSYQGETVVDLWGGVADPQTGRLWEEDSVTLVWSSTKGAVSLCIHMLAAQGLLDLEAPVAQYWPEFAAQGKEQITIAMLLSHQAGLPAFTRAVPPHAYCEWDTIVQELAAQKPLWEPGTQHGYHALSFGHLLGEVLRRVTGRSLGRFFREEVAEPLGLDFWIGLPEALEDRFVPNVAPTTSMQETPSKFALMAFQKPGSIPHLFFTNSGAIMVPGAMNQRAYRAAEIPAANGITHARGLAGLYRPLALGGRYGSVELLPEDAMNRLGAVRSAGMDQTLQLPTRFSLGFFKACDNRRSDRKEGDSFLVSEDAFGHPGLGGSVGFADPRAELSFGYAMNRPGSGLCLDARGQSLIDASYRSLGYQQSRFDGLWYSDRSSQGRVIGRLEKTLDRQPLRQFQEPGFSTLSRNE